MKAFIFFVVFFNQSLLSQPVQTAIPAGAYYFDKYLSISILKASYIYSDSLISEEQGFLSTLSLNTSYKTIKPNRADTSVDFAGKSSLNITSVELSYDQGVRVGTDVGISMGEQRSETSTFKWMTLRGSQWFYQETIQLSLSVRDNQMNQTPSDYTDVDGKRIVTPHKVEGRNYGLNLYAFLSTRSILLGDYSITQKSNRPDAWAFSLQLRQYIDALAGSFHLSGSHYENVGQIGANTAYGTLVSNSFSGEWHQKIKSRYIGMVGYRFHMEDENPRANESALDRNGSDFVYSSLRYRFKDIPFTESSSELSALLGKYVNNKSNQGMIASFGGILIF